MVAQITQSKLDIFNTSTVDDSGGVEPLASLDHGSSQSDIMGTDVNSDFVTVTNSLQGLLQEMGSDTGENIVNLDRDLMAGDSGNDDPILSFNKKKSLTFTDRKAGILNNSDHLYEEGYSDEYQLTGFLNNKTVTLDLQALNFSSSLQLLNQQTGEVIQQQDLTTTDNNGHSQLVFTTEKDANYLVRVTSTESATTGDYVLATTAGELRETLVFSDIETGVLDQSDQTHGGRYRDEYILRGLEDQQTVVINLEGMGFDSSLQLVNRETGEVIDRIEGMGAEGMFRSQLTFTNNNNIEYLVRVTTTEENITGSYTLGTTLGELTLGISDQTIQGSITESDETVDLWTRSNTDVYEITQFSHFQTINITLESFEETTFLLLFNADTGERITSSIGYRDRNDGIYRANINYTPIRDRGINYGLVATFYGQDRFGDYTLKVDTDFSLAGGFNSNYETTHPIIRSRFMDNFLLTDLQVGQDVELNLTSNSSDNMVQLFDQDTGTVLESTQQSDLVFTVEAGINYGVRILGQAGDTYNLKTNTGILFDSNPTQLNQTITNSLSSSDALAYFKNFRSTTHTYYSDGYYLSAESLMGKDEVTIDVKYDEFLPELHLINPQTGDILETYNRYNFDTKSMSYNVNIEEGMDYLVLVSSLYRQQEGEYTFTVNS